MESKHLHSGLSYKRLHRAVFVLPLGEAGAPAVRIDGGALARLLAGHARRDRSAAAGTAGGESLTRYADKY